MAEIWPSPRRRRTVSLRAMMLLILLAATGLGWRVNRAHSQVRTVASIEKAGGSVWYDYQFDGKQRIANASPWGPVWIRRTLGDEYFQEVTSVTLGDQTTDDLLAEVEHLDGLIEVRLIEADKVNEAGFVSLARLKRLRIVQIWGGKITDVGLAHLAGLQHLETLDFYDTHGITDAAMAQVARMTELQSLILFANTKIAETGFAQIARLPHLRELRIVDSDITDGALICLKNFQTLRVLNLSGNPRISDAGMHYLAGLTGLQALDLAETEVSDSGIRQLRKLQQLRKLNLFRTWVTDAEAARAKAAIPGLIISRDGRSILR
jgi:Leucine rich repeat